MAQILVPVADEATGSWTVTPLWSKVDDDSTVSPSGDGTTIASDNNTSPDTADFQLSSGSDPGVDTGHVLRARWNKDGSGGHNITAALELYQGPPSTGTFIAQLQNLVGDTEALGEHTLTAFQASQITDYSNLYLQLIRSGDTGGNPNGRRSLVVDLVEFEVPDAGAPTQTIAVGAVSETESAQTVTPVPGAVSATVSAVSESEAAQTVAVTSVVSVTVGAVAEAESAQTVTATPGVVSVAVGAVSETETAQIVSPAQQGGTQTIAVGTVSEVESAQTVTPASAITVAVATVTETETVGAVTVTPGAILVTVGAAGESETAQTVVAAPGGVTVAVGAVGEVETAQTVSPVLAGGSQTVSVGSVSETEASQTVTPAAGAVTVTVGAVSETEAIQTVAAGSTVAVTIGVVSETESVSTVGVVPGAVTVTVGTVAETETVQTVAAQAGVAQSVPVGTVTESETAGSLELLLTVLTIVGRQRGQFFRLGNRLALIPLGRGIKVGFRPREGWEKVSSIFVYDTLRGQADHTHAQLAAEDAWAAEKGSDAAVLAAAIDQGLQDRGFRSPHGNDLA